MLASLVAMLVVSGSATAAPRNGRSRALLFVPSFSSNVVSVFDVRDNSLVKQIGIEASGACCTYVSPDQRSVYVVAGTSNHVSVIDTTTLTVKKVISIPGTWGDRGSPLPSDGKTFWADTLPEFDLVAIDTTTLEVTKTIVDAGAQFENSRDGKWLFLGGVRSATDPTKTTFVVRSADTGAVVASIPLPHGPGILTKVSPDGSTVFLLGNPDLPAPFTMVQRSWVDVIDVRDPVQPRVVNSFLAGSNVETGEFTPDGGELWIPGMGDGTITVIDVESQAVRRTILTDRSVCGVGFAGDRAYVLATKEPNPPTYATSMTTGCLNVVQGSLTAPRSGLTTSRPVLDTPSEMLIFDRTTYQPLDVPPVPLPSVAYYATLVNVPLSG